MAARAIRSFGHSVILTLGGSVGRGLTTPVDYRFWNVDEARGRCTSVRSNYYCLFPCCFKLLTPIDSRVNTEAKRGQP